MVEDRVQDCPSTPGKLARVSRDRQVIQCIVDGLTKVEIAKKFNITDRTVRRIYQRYLQTEFVYDITADFLRLKKKVKSEVAFQGVVKLLGDYLKSKDKQAPSVNVNVNNNLSDVMKQQIDELIQVSEAQCKDHPTVKPAEA